MILPFRIELAMTFTGFPLCEETIPERPIQWHRGLHVRAVRHNNYVAAFRQSIFGQMMPKKMCQSGMHMLHPTLNSNNRSRS
jgi:hypothetical protein